MNICFILFPLLELQEWCIQCLACCAACVNNLRVALKQRLEHGRILTQVLAVFELHELNIFEAESKFFSREVDNTNKSRTRESDITSNNNLETEVNMLKKDEAPGPAKIFPKVLRECKEIIS